MTAAIMIQLITGAIGSVGFGILFHIKKKYLPRQLCHGGAAGPPLGAVSAAGGRSRHRGAV